MSKRGEASLSKNFPLCQRGTKGDLKSLSISLYEREKPDFREFKERGIKVEDSSRGGVTNLINSGAKVGVP